VADNISFIAQETYFIGDKVSDIEAGKNFKLKTAFVRTGWGRDHEPKITDSLRPDILADNLLEAAQKVTAE